MGGGGSSAPASQPTQQTITSNPIADWAQPTATALIGSQMNNAFNIDSNGNVLGSRGFTPFGGATNSQGQFTGAPVSQDQYNQQLQVAGLGVAGPSALQQQSYQGAANLQVPGQYRPASQMAGYGTMQALGAGQNYAQQATDPNAVGAYMNPFVQNALAPSLALQNQQFGQIAAQNAGQATQAGAFGGGRDAVVQGLNQQNQMLAQNQLVGNAYNQAYTNAQQAQQFGSNLGLQGAQAGIQGANTLAGIGGQQLAAQQGVLGTQNQMGVQEQQNQQNLINQAMQNYSNQQQYPQQQTANIMNLLRSTPTTQTQTVYQAPPNAVSQIAGLGTAGVAGYKLATMAGGGIAKAKKFDIGGEVEHDLYDLPTDNLAEEVKNTTSQKLKQMGTAILRERALGTEPPPQGFAPGGIVAFAEGGKSKKEAYAGESEDDSLINNIMMSGMSQGMMPSYTQMRQAPARTETPSGSTFEKAMQFVLPHEAGYVNHPSDRGGPTNRGVTQATLSGYLGRPATIDDVKNLDEQTARDIYKTKFFDPIASKLKDPKAQMVAFNAAIASGPGYANKLIEKHEGDPYAMWQEHTKYMTHDIPKANPSQNVFVKGWNNRQQDLLNAVKNNFASGGEVQHFAEGDVVKSKESIAQREAALSAIESMKAPPLDFKGSMSDWYNTPQYKEQVNAYNEAKKAVRENNPIYSQLGSYNPYQAATSSGIANIKNKPESKPVPVMSDEEYAKYNAMNAAEDLRNNKLSPTFRNYGYQNNMASETMNPIVKPVVPEKISNQGIASVVKNQAPASQFGPSKDLMEDKTSTAPTAPTATDRYSELMDMLKGQQKQVGEQKQQDKWLALLEGSLGTMAGTSPYALQNIGAGGQKGIASYAAANKQRGAEQSDILGQMIGLQKVKGLEDYQNRMADITGQHYGQQYELGKAKNKVEEARLNQLQQQFGSELGYKYFAAEQLNDYHTKELDQQEKLKIPQMLEAHRKNAYSNVLNRRKIGIEALDDPATKASVDAEVEQELMKGGVYPKLYKDYLGVDFTPTPRAAPNSNAYTSNYGLTPKPTK